jgi:hypothetical protein
MLLIVGAAPPQAAQPFEPVRLSFRPLRLRRCSRSTAGLFGGPSALSA